MKIIGMISGTSFDGIDVALVDINEVDAVLRKTNRFSKCSLLQRSQK